MNIAIVGMGSPESLRLSLMVALAHMSGGGAIFVVSAKPESESAEESIPKLSADVITKLLAPRKVPNPSPLVVVEDMATTLDVEDFALLKVPRLEYLKREIQYDPPVSNIPFYLGVKSVRRKSRHDPHARATRTRNHGFIRTQHKV